MMKKNEKRCLLLGSVFLAMFVLWTALIQMVDVQSVGQNETSIDLQHSIAGFTI